MNEQNRDLTLDDLINEKKEAVKANEKADTVKSDTRFKTVSISDIAGPSKTISPREQAEMEMFSEIDIAINRTKQDLMPIIEKGKEIIMQNKLDEKEVDDTEVDYEPTTLQLSIEDTDEYEENKEDIIPQSTYIKESAVDVKDIEYELEDDEEEDFRNTATTISDEEREEIINNFKAQIKAVIKPAKERLDISKFSIRSKAVSVSKVLATKLPTKHVSDWVLPNTKRSISISEFSGSDIEKLRVDGDRRNRINAIKDMYTTIYDHVLDGNKPKTLEEWVKNISWLDREHLEFAIYKACFENTNYIPYICINPKCNHTFIVQKKITDMIKYKNDEAKQKIRKLFEKDSTSPDTFETSLLPISDDYCVTLRPPSIYNVVFENSTLDDGFRSKYAEFLGAISFIENIYSIEHATQELVPIEFKTDPNDIIKTVKYKIRGMSKILSKLTSDEFAELINATNAILQEEDDSCSYVYPEVECPKCKQKIEERAESPLNMVFTRHRLTTIANS